MESVLVCRIALLFCIVAALSIPVQAQSPAQSYGTISGKVMSDDGPVPFAAVTVSATGARDRNNGMRNLTSDAEGNFKAEGLRAAAYIVTASSPGYVAESASLLPSEGLANQTDPPAPTYYRIGDTATIRLIKGGVITGRVLNQMGDPMIGIRVTAQLVINVQPQRTFAGAGSGETQTDDRGVYRIYGLGAGNYLVSANPTSGPGGQFASQFGAQFPGRPLNPYAGNAPVYHPSGSRGMASEVMVNCGVESGGIDIQYRPIKGSSISGVVAGSDPGFTVVTLTDKPSGQVVNTAFVAPRGGQARRGPADGQQGFSIQGVADGEYELSAQGGSPEDSFSAAPVKVTVSGADVTGLVLNLKPMAAIRASVQIETPIKCNATRPASLDEQVFSLRPINQPSPPNQPTSVPNPSGAISFGSLSAGKYQLGAVMLDERYFIRSIAAPVKTPARNTAAAQKNPPAMFELSRNGITLKAGEKLTDIVVAVSEGAASIDGQVVKAGGTQVTETWRVHLVPADRELADEVLRYSETSSGVGGNFKFRNIAPGKYLLLAVPATSGDSQAAFHPTDPAARLRLRRAAETANQPIELQPCGKVGNIQIRSN
ncbi:MAG: carboxypeptidase regulatory-like domain-containing protein [Acidobacteria bacterium]|nr:carboxypeptidase regulatory-like domain-containing protein [Acidobacteriota bacterium]